MLNPMKLLSRKMIILYQNFAQIYLSNFKCSFLPLNTVNAQLFYAIVFSKSQSIFLGSNIRIILNMGPTGGILLNKNHHIPQ